MMRKDSRVLKCLAIFMALSFAAAGGEDIVADGGRVVVETQRYRAVFDGFSCSGVENKLTGEVYVKAAPAGQAGTSAEAALASRCGVAIESLRPAVPVVYYRICPKTKISSEKTQAGMKMSFVGLEGSYGVTTDFADKLTATIEYAVEKETGDLVVSPAVKGNLGKELGVQDRGIYRCAMPLLGLADDLRLVIPSDHGIAYGKGNAPASLSQNPLTLPWPLSWEAALFIGEGKKGSFGLWADEPKLRYARNLSFCRSSAGWDAVVEFESMEMNYRCDEISGAAWRLNVFDGNWLKPAARYKAQMSKQWPELQPLSKQKPAWANDIRLLVEPGLPDEKSFGGKLASLPKGSAAVFCREGWSLNYKTFETAPIKAQDSFWPSQRAWNFAMPEGLPERIAKLEAQGVHIFAYANHNLCDKSSWMLHPHSCEPLQNAAYPGYMYLWQPWARFFPEACAQHAKETGASGICEGFSWAMRRCLGDTPKDENWFTGSLAMRKYLRTLLPETALMGDQLNEITLRGQQLSRAVTLDPARAHPVSSFLFGEFARQWSASPLAEINEADDIHGFLQGWLMDGEKLPAAMRNIMMLRGELFAKEGLESVWPEKWEANVLHYYKDKSGIEYRLLRDKGTRLVKLAGGKEETLYWRIRGQSEAQLEGQSIAGWVAYDGERAIGLNPASVYLPEKGAPRPEVCLASLPEGAQIARTLCGNGFWTVDIATQGKDAEATIKVKGGEKPVSFLNAGKVEKKGAEYAVTLKLPGTLVAYWIDPPSANKLEAQSCTLRMMRPSMGIVSSSAKLGESDSQLLPPVGMAETGEGSVMAWLVTTPLEPSWLVFKFGCDAKENNIPFTEGIDYRVRINGKVAWQRLRKDLSPEWNGKAMALTAKKVLYGAADLRKLSDTPVLIELEAFSAGASIGNKVEWSAPVFQEELPNKDVDADLPKDLPGKDELPSVDMEAK